MKKKFLVLLAIGFFIFGMSVNAIALTVSDLYGDMDGFGGVVTGPNQVFEFLHVSSIPVGEGITDYWLYNEQSWSHTFDTSSLGTITSATLEVFTGGIGTASSSASIYVDEQLVGSIPLESKNYSRLNVFDLMGISSFLDGDESIRVLTFSDGWTLDYSKITLSDDVTPVPEPATTLLLGSGLVGLAGFRRKFRKK